MSAFPPTFQVTPAQIDAQVTAFYAAVRVHPVLGPVFAAHVQDWDAHEAKIARFWRNAILHERNYHGSPLMVHRQAGNVEAAHFPIWLALFDEVLARTQPPEVARPWSTVAHRIGRALSMGLADAERPSDAVPRL